MSDQILNNKLLPLNHYPVINPHTESVKTRQNRDSVMTCPVSFTVANDVLYDP